MQKIWNIQTLLQWKKLPEEWKQQREGEYFTPFHFRKYEEICMGKKFAGIKQKESTMEHTKKCRISTIPTLWNRDWTSVRTGQDFFLHSLSLATNSRKRHRLLFPGNTDDDLRLISLFEIHGVVSSRKNSVPSSGAGSAAAAAAVSQLIRWSGLRKGLSQV